MTVQICCQNCSEPLNRENEFDVTVELSVPDAEDVELTHHFCTHACFAEWVETMPNDNYRDGFSEYFEDSSYTSP